MARLHLEKIGVELETLQLISKIYCVKVEGPTNQNTIGTSTSHSQIKLMLNFVTFEQNNVLCKKTML